MAKLGMDHWGLKSYKVYRYDDPVLNLSYLRTRSTMGSYAFKRGNVFISYIKLKHSIIGQSVFLLTTKLYIQGVFCPCPRATDMYMNKSIQIYTRCQVSVYRTTGPLVYSLLSHTICETSDERVYSCFRISVFAVQTQNVWK